MDDGARLSTPSTTARTVTCGGHMPNCLGTMHSRNLRTWSPRNQRNRHHLSCARRICCTRCQRRLPCVRDELENLFQSSQHRSCFSQGNELMLFSRQRARAEGPAHTLSVARKCNGRKRLVRLQVCVISGLIVLSRTSSGMSTNAVSLEDLKACHVGGVTPASMPVGVGVSSLLPSP